MVPFFIKQVLAGLLMVVQWWILIVVRGLGLRCGRRLKYPAYCRVCLYPERIKSSSPALPRPRSGYAGETPKSSQL
jgi:hypothetical protein